MERYLKFQGFLDKLNMKPLSMEDEDFNTALGFSCLSTPRYEKNRFSGSIYFYFKEIDDENEDTYEDEYEDFCEKGYVKQNEAGMITFHAFNLMELGASLWKMDDEWENESEYKCLFSAMDYVDSDQELYYSVFRELAKKVIDKQGISESDFYEMLDKGEWLICLDRFYINKEYRNKGISNYVHNNLYSLISYMFNINPIFVCGTFVPDKDDEISITEMIELQKKAYNDSKSMITNVGENLCFCKFIYPIED